MIRLAIILCLISTSAMAEKLLLASKGAQLFRIHCAACHGLRGQGGSMCPPNKDASLELLKLKVLEGRYPKDYKPKKGSRVMPKFPFLKNDIENIFEYLKGA